MPVFILGQVLLDKHKNLKSVVNKTDSIDNTYRNFAMDLLAGKDSMDVAVTENGCTYKFDFSKVYWNSRLGKLENICSVKINKYMHTLGNYLAASCNLVAKVMITLSALEWHPPHRRPQGAG